MVSECLFGLIALYGRSVPEIDATDETTSVAEGGSARFGPFRMVRTRRPKCQIDREFRYGGAAASGLWFELYPRGGAALPGA